MAFPLQNHWGSDLRRVRLWHQNKSVGLHIFRKCLQFWTKIGITLDCLTLGVFHKLCLFLIVRFEKYVITNILVSMSLPDESQILTPCGFWPYQKWNFVFSDGWNVVKRQQYPFFGFQSTVLCRFHKTNKEISVIQHIHFIKIKINSPF